AASGKAWRWQTLSASLFTGLAAMTATILGAAQTLYAVSAIALLFREGFKVAGDDTLLDVIQRYVLPALQTQLQKSGIADASQLMASLFGDSGRIDTQAVLRQQTA
ncbi:virulence factor SrfB, partial [Enterobacter sp. BH2-YP2023]|uniref:virulence factor SrfB n=1 Tax=Enterobacter sp. BH2-YP2023 TaxID=3402818 RepID=UPI003D730F63